MSSTRLIGAVVTAGTGAVLAAVLTTPADAAPGDCPEGAGAAGRSCVIPIDDLTGLHLGAGINAGTGINLGTRTGDCSSDLALLVDLRLRATTDTQRLRDDRAAAKTAEANLKAAEVARDKAKAADMAEDATKPDTSGTPPVTVVDQQDTDVTTTAAAFITASKAAAAADTQVDADQRATARDAQLIADLKIQLGQLCNQPPASTTPPPPVVIQQQPGTIIVAPPPVVQQDNGTGVPVTG